MMAESLIPEGSVDEFIKEQNANTHEQELRAAVVDSVGANPDEYAKTLKLAKDTGLPPDVVAKDPQAIEKQEFFDKALGQALFEIPQESHDWFKKNSKLVSDDFSMIGTIKHYVTEFPKAISLGDDDLEANTISSKEVFGTLTPEEAARLTELEAKLKDVDYTSGEHGTTSQAILGAAFTAPQIVDQITGGVRGAVGGAGVGAVAGTFIEPIGGTITGAGIGGKLGFDAGSAYKNYIQQSGAVMRDLKKVKNDDGQALDANVMRGAAFVVGGSNGVLDLLPMHKFLKTVPGLDNLFAKYGEKILSKEGIKQALKVPAFQRAMYQVGKRLAVLSATEGGVEGLQQAVQILGTEAAKGMSDADFEPISFGDAVEQIGSAAKGGAVIGAAIGTPTSAASIPFEVKRQRNLKPDQVKAHVEGINAAVPGDKLFQRSPDAFKALVDTLAPGEKFYIDGEVALQVVNSLPEDQRTALLAAVPDLSVQLSEAQDTGGYVSLSKADYATYVAPYPQAQALSDHIKLDMADQSFAEKMAADQFAKENPDLAMQLQQDKPGVAPQEIEVAVERYVRKAMLAAGRPQAEARVNATLAAKMYSRFAAPLGKTATDFMQNYLGFRQVGADGTTILNDGSNIGIIAAEWAALKAGKNVPGLNEQSRAAVEDFGKKLEAANIAPEQAVKMGSEELWKQLYSPAVAGENLEPDATLEQSPSILDRVVDFVKSPLGQGAVQQAAEVIQPLVPPLNEAGNEIYNRLFQGGGDQYGIAGFYSKLHRYATEKLNKTGTPKQFEQQIEAAIKNGAFKADEYYWSGLKEFFDSLAPDMKIDKASVIDWLNNNKLDIKEKIYDRVKETVKVPINRTENGFDRSQYPTEDDIEWDDAEQQEPDQDSINSELEWLVDSFKSDNDPEDWFKEGNEDDLVIAKNLDAEDQPTDETEYEWDDDAIEKREEDTAIRYAQDRADYVLKATVGDYRYEGYFNPESDYMSLRRWNGREWKWLDDPTGRANEENLQQIIREDMYNEGILYSEDQVNEMEDEWNEEQQRLQEERLNTDAGEEVSEDRAKELLADGEQGVRLVSDYENIPFYTEFDIPFLEKALAQGGFGERKLVTFKNDNRPLTVDVDTALKAAEKGYKVFFVNDGLDKDELNVIGSGLNPETTLLSNGYIKDVVQRKSFIAAMDEKKAHLAIVPKNTEVEGVDFRMETRWTGQLNWETHQEGGAKGSQHELVIQLPKISEGNMKNYQHSWRDAKGSNILMHMRFNERENADGERTLFIEEIQSDWHQKGEELGYASPEDVEQLNKDKAAEKELFEAKVAEYSKELHAAHEADREGFISGENMPERFAGYHLAHQENASGVMVYRLFFGTDDQVAERTDAHDFVGYLARELAREETADLRKSISEREAALNDKIPNAPFNNLNKYTELAMKRMILWAVHNGYERVAWTTGQQQAERWSGALQKQIERIKVHGADADNYHISVFGSRGYGDISGFLAQNVKGATLVESENGNYVSIPKKEVSSYFGKSISDSIEAKLAEPADKKITELPEGVFIDKEDGYDYFQARSKDSDGDKVNYYGPKVVKDYGFKDHQIHTGETIEEVRQSILDGLNAEHEQNRGVIAGQDITINSKGMIEVYNKVMVNIANGLIKKYGGKVSTTRIDTETNASGDRVMDEMGIPPGDRAQYWKDLTQEKRDELIKEFQKGTQQWSFPVTDKMKESVLAEGFPLFQRERGYLQTALPFTTEDFAGRLSKVVMGFTRGANQSTAPHEFSHFGVAMHRHFAVLARHAMAQGNDDPEVRRIVDDWEALKKHIGADNDIFTREQEEKVAVAFEDYLQAGVAPSEDLRGIFTRFRQWLVAIYGNIRRSGIDVDPKISEVFDRWLASEEEIAKVKDGNNSIANIAAALGLPPDIIDKVGQYVASSISESEEKLYRELKSEQSAMESAAYKKEYDAVAKDVRDEIKVRREYQLQEYMKENGFKFLEGPETEGLDPELTTPDGDNIHPDDIADLFGYTSGRDLLRALKQAPALDRAVDVETRKRLLDKFPNMIAQGKLKSRAQNLIMNDKTMLALDLVIKELGKAVGGANKHGMKQFAKMIAQQQIAGIKASDSNIGYRYEIQRDKSIREALKASRAGNPKAALLHLQRAMVNQAVHKGLEEFNEVKAKAQDLFWRVNRKDKKLAAGLDIDFVGAARYVLDKFGMANPERWDKAKFLADINALDPDIAQDLIGMAMAENTPAKPAEELTIPEFLSVYDAVQNIIGEARRQKEFTIGEKKAKAELAEQELIAQMGDNLPKLSGSTQVTGGFWLRSKLSTIKAAVRRVEAWTEAMDGGKDGPFKRYIFQPLKNAEDKYRAAREKWMGGYRDILKEHEGILSDRTKIETDMFKRDANGRMERLIFSDAMEMVGFLLHTGNESNLDKLLGGYGIPIPEYKAALADLERRGVLTKEHYDLTQKLWDYVDGIKPQMQAAHKKLYGFRFQEIENSPLETKLGYYKGGYWPAIVNADLAEDSKTLEQIMESSRQYMLATTNKGFTMERVEGYKQPLQTDLRLGSQHIDKVLRFVHLEPAARDMTRIINRREFRAKLHAIDPDAYAGLLRSFVSRVVTQSMEPSPPMGDKGASMGRSLINKARSSATMQLIAYSATVAIQNVANVPVAVYLKPREMLSGFASMTAHPIDNFKQMISLSTQQRERLTTNHTLINQQIAQIADRKWKVTKGKDFMVRHAYIFMRGIDSYLSGVIWTGTFNTEMQKHGDQTKAVEEADSVVRKVMGASGSTDVSKIEASHPVVKAIMPFYSYFNAQANLIGTEFGNIMRQHGWAGTPRMFIAYLMLIAAPAVVGQALIDALRDNLPDDDDDDGQALDDWFAYFMKTQLKYLAAMTPIVGQGTNAIINALNDNPMDDRLSISPIVSAADTVISAGQKAFSDKDVDDATFIRQVATALGFATGTPLGQAGKSLGYAVGVANDEINPSDAFDYSKGLIAGKPKVK